jgi:hypothetical protein
MDTSRKLDRLTTAVWVLVAISALHLVVTLYGLWPYITQTSRASTAYAPPQVSESIDRYANFHEWPVEKQIQAASVIALAKHTVEKDQVKTVVAEILKQTPGTTFYYKIGDEWGTHQPLRPNTSYGEGQVMFFVGSPAQFRFSTSYHRGRITGLGDMPLDLFRKKIREQR